MIRISDNIISPLGNGTAANFAAVASGKSGLRLYEGHWGLPEAFVASLFSEEQKAEFMLPGHSEFESLAITSIRKVLEDGSRLLPEGWADKKTVLILSTTKAEVSQLSSTDERPENIYPGAVAKRISTAAGIAADPIVVCNACISGLSAIILAQRLLDGGFYDYAVVCGIDLQSPFIVSGFQSFKALSPVPCRPFDMERLGLNLGEAAASILFARESCQEGGWSGISGSVRNDAYHISAPSNKGDGAYLALRQVLDGKQQPLSFVNVHGTGTMFNDQMESVALRRAGLTETPVNAFKGYFGHTMGASGVLETILCFESLDHGIVLGTKGFSELGVSGKLDISAQNRPSSGKAFVKMLSGFGGCNAAVLAGRLSEDHGSMVPKPKATVTHSILISPGSAIVDGVRADTSEKGLKMLTEIFKSLGTEYPKFYKMDPLSRLGFVASELLLRAEGSASGEYREDRAVILFNRSSSLAADKKYLLSIEDRDAFYPSPSLFVYTLPNIVCGEIAIRNKYRGETSFYILPEKSERLMGEILSASATDPKTDSAIAGWVDYEDELHFSAEMCIFVL